eukprot:NODE_224_length_1087_cov_8.185685_g221_i0.p2 GENE.NODE_224_length_1087_cov_8.185685_g221_i0~~NODE_224_length_1087_cov_8.185685_g221_i0.p2  ORF type:complete len:138 (+),score=5.03 NODE_224_length_1087_cov_8.185685_g221_i0:450-863(+)
MTVFFREYQELQKTIQRLETLGVNNPPPPTEVSDQHLSQFDGWRIVGYSRYSDRVYYDLQPPAEDKKIGPDEELRVVSSRDLTSYDIRPVSPCHMRIGSGSAFTDIFLLLAGVCIDFFRFRFSACPAALCCAFQRGR